MHLLADDIRNVSLSNGLVRIECTTTGADGQTQVSGELVIPAGQYGTVVKALQNAGQQLQERVQSRESEQETAWGRIARTDRCMQAVQAMTHLDDHHGQIS